nr:RHS repeat-associated core domain-containing protein [Methyloversatilis sp. XJ19-13]
MLYLELDHLGTPRQARIDGGAIVWRWESDGYGTSPANEDPDGNGQPTTVNLRFPGQYYDEESGLHYNRHRYYVPRLGRYLSSDPIGIEGGTNTFAYANASPIRYIDPKGLVVGVDDAIVIGGTIAVGACIATNCTKPIGDAMQSVANTLSNGINTIKEWCGDDGESDDPCEARRKLEEGLCEGIAIQWGRAGVRTCKKSAFVRYSECRRFGPNGVTTPLHGVDTPL